MRRLAAALLFAAIPAFANDATPARDPDIALSSVDMTVSDKAVHVVYEFVNHGAADKTATLAFPLPDVPPSATGEFGLPSAEISDPFHFHLTTDGQQASVRLEASAFVGERDVTARLKALRVPLAPFSKDVGDALFKLKTLDKSALMKDGVAAPIASGEAPSLNGPHLTPGWTWRAAYLWRQTFAPGRSVRIVEDYAPDVGRAAATSVGMKGAPVKIEGRDYKSYFCLDDTLLDDVKRATAATQEKAPPFAEERMTHVLRAAGNVAGSIGRFHLIVDKGAANNLLSFCGEGVRKLDATRFEMSANDFTPKDDLHILILTPMSH